MADRYQCTELTFRSAALPHSYEKYLDWSVGGDCGFTRYQNSIIGGHEQEPTKRSDHLRWCAHRPRKSTEPCIYKIEPNETHTTGYSDHMRGGRAPPPDGVARLALLAGLLGHEGVAEHLLRVLPDLSAVRGGGPENREDQH